MNKRPTLEDKSPTIIHRLKKPLMLLMVFILMVFGSIYLSTPLIVLADDLQPTATPEESEPSFPTYTPDLDQPFDQAPLYDVPLALNAHDHFYLIKPIANGTNTTLLPDFRYGYFYPEEDAVHTGVDIPSPLHTPVLAAGDGQVIFTGYGLLNGGGDPDDPYGLAVLIKHDFNFEGKTLYTVYAHLDRIDVEKDQIVKSSDPVGIIGMTGNTSGPHVHFEVRVEDEVFGRVQNPELWIAPPVGSGVLTGRLKNDFGYLIGTKDLSLRSLKTGVTYQIQSYADVKQIYSDDHFMENFVIGDLPEGEYEISMLYKYKWYRINVMIIPGTVTFINFDGKQGFSLNSNSSTLGDEFLP